MRKILLLLTIGLISIFCAGAISSPDSPFFEDPAYLYFYNQTHTFGSEFKFGFSPDSDWSEPFTSSPYFSLKASFTSKYAQAGLSVNNEFKGRNLQGNYVNYDIFNALKFDVNVAYGTGVFGLGASIEGGTTMWRQNCSLYYSSIVQDFFNQALFAEYTRISGTEYLNIRGGLGLKVEDFTLYATVPALFTYRDSTTYFSFEDMYRSLRLSINYNGNRFGERARLRTFVFDANVAGNSILDSETRSIEVGAAFTLQLSRDRNIRLELTYEGPLFGSPVDEIIGAGLYYSAGSLVIGAEASVPFASVTSGISYSRCYFTLKSSFYF